MSSFSKTNEGFTLIEMLVVVAIFAIMTSILLANLPEFRDRSSLELLAQQAAINVRTAQVYGIGTKASSVEEGESGEPTSRFKVWYGISFAEPVTVDNNPGLKSFTLFADRGEKNGVYDPDLNEREQEYLISGSRYGIAQVCGVRADNSKDCNLGPVNIIYRRPYTEAFFCRSSAPCYPGDTWINDFTRISLILKAVGSTQAKEVSIWSNGQISVESGYVEVPAQ
jgi:prepilin-type N-terminal cleavage/methylation domain-containing protein